MRKVSPKSLALTAACLLVLTVLAAGYWYWQTIYNRPQQSVSVPQDNIRFVNSLNSKRIEFNSDKLTPYVAEQVQTSGLLDSVITVTFTDNKPDKLVYSVKGENQLMTGVYLTNVDDKFHIIIYVDSQLPADDVVTLANNSFLMSLALVSEYKKHANQEVVYTNVINSTNAELMPLMPDQYPLIFNEQ